MGAFLLAALTVQLTAPLAIRIARRTTFYDRPGGYKAHARPTPYLGGAAVLGAFLVGAFAFAPGLRGLWAIFAGTVVLCAVGTLDDRVGLPILRRLLAEASVAVLLWAAGLGWSLGLGAAFDLTVTVIWVVGLVNAFNLMDNMDGAASGVTAACAAGVGLLAVLQDAPEIAVVALPRSAAQAWAFCVSISLLLRAFSWATGEACLSGCCSPQVSWRYRSASTRLAGTARGDAYGRTASLRHDLCCTLALAAGGACLLRWPGSHNPSAAGIRVVATRCDGRAGYCADPAVWRCRWQPGAGSRRSGDCGSGLSARGRTAHCAAGIGVGSHRRRWRHALSPPAEPRTAHQRRRPPLLEGVLLLAFAGACGASMFADGFYNLSAWGPFTLALLGLVLALVIARPALPVGPAALALAALGFLWLWALLSTGWAESVDRALTESNRWLLLGAMLAFLLLLLRERRLRVLLVAGAAAAIVGVALFITATLLLETGARSSSAVGSTIPLGYTNGEAVFLLLGFWPAIAAAERADAHRCGRRCARSRRAAGRICCSSRRRERSCRRSRSRRSVLVALVPGRARRLWALVLVAGAAVGLAAGPLLDVYQQGSVGRLVVDDSTAHMRGWPCRWFPLGAGAIWAVACALVARNAKASLLSLPVSRTVSAVALAALVLVGTGIGAARAGSITTASATPRGLHQPCAPVDRTSTRLLSGSGNRYDYWRIAWHQFRDQPLRGVGAGNYHRTPTSASAAPRRTYASLTASSCRRWRSSAWSAQRRSRCSSGQCSRVFGARRGPAPPRRRSGRWRLPVAACSLAGWS